MVEYIFKKDGAFNGNPDNFPEDTFSLQQALALLIMLKIAKMPGGLRVIESWGKEFIKGLTDMFHALSQASAANKVSAWANPYLISIFLRRLGLLTSFDIVQFRVGLSVITGAVVAEGFLDTIQGFFPFSKPEPSEFPSQIVFSAREAGVEVPETITWEQLKAISEKPRLLPRGRKKK